MDIPQDVTYVVLVVNFFSNFAYKIVWMGGVIHVFGLVHVMFGLCKQLTKYRNYD